MFWVYKAYSISKHPVKYLMKRAVMYFTLASFLITSVISSGQANALIEGTLAMPGDEKMVRDILTDLRDGVFDMPQDIGYVQDTYIGTSERVVVYIQDAHCDYYAQKAVSRIVKHLKLKYGVSLLCLEGGAGEYDLSPFTDIREEELRAKVGDFFMAQGMMTGAEYAASMAPGSYALWGVEDVELYKRNLKVYRDSVKYRAEVGIYLAKLSEIMGELKKGVYSEDLYQLDLKYTEFKDKKLPFKDYLEYMMGVARANLVPLKELMNVYLLKQVLDAEEKIDFRAANTERDKFIADLQGKMSRNQAEELARETLRFRLGETTQKEYYNYLLTEGKKVGIETPAYPSFKDYIVYISIYSSIDKSVLAKELSKLEDTLREALCAGDGKQAKLLSLSKNFTLVNKAFEIQLTKPDFDYYRENASSFKTEELVDFIRKEAPAAKVRAVIPEDKVGFDDRVKEIAEFYDLSFERDDIFLANVKKEMDETGYRTALLLTGGFHTDNLAGLMRKEGYSYVTILPRFKDKEGYENPYFEILAGSEAPFGKTVAAAFASVSNLQVASIWNRLGLEVDGLKTENAAKIMVEIAKKLVDKKTAVVAIEEKGAKIIFSRDSSGRVRYEVAKLLPKDVNIAVVAIKDMENFSYEDHETIIDKQLEKAYAEDARDKGVKLRVSNIDEAVKSSVEDFFKAIGKPEVAQAIKNGTLPIKQVDGIVLFEGHAGGRGIHVSSVGADISPGAERMRRLGRQGAVIVHEIGAFYKQPHSLNLEMEKLYENFIGNGIEGTRNTQTIEIALASGKFKGIDTNQTIKTGETYEGRDYAADEGQVPEKRETVTEKIGRLFGDAKKRAAQIYGNKPSSSLAGQGKEENAGETAVLDEPIPEIQVDPAVRKRLEKMLRERKIQLALNPIEREYLFKGMERIDRVLTERNTEADVSNDEVLGDILRDESLRKELALRERLYVMLIAENKDEIKSEKITPEEIWKNATSEDVQRFVSMMKIMAQEIPGKKGIVGERVYLEHIERAFERYSRIVANARVTKIDNDVSEKRNPDEESETGSRLAGKKGGSEGRPSFLGDFPLSTDILFPEEVTAGAMLEVTTRQADGPSWTDNVRVLGIPENMADIVKDPEVMARAPESLRDFLDGWKIVTIENNNLMSGCVDFSKKNIYVSERIKIAANVSPKIIPMLILGEAARDDNGRSPMRGLADVLGLKDITDGDAARIARGLDPRLAAAWPDIIKELSSREINPNVLTIKGVIRALNKEREKRQTEPIPQLSSADEALIRRNVNAGNEQLNMGFLDQLFQTENGTVRSVMESVRQTDGTEVSMKNLAQALLILNYGSWVVFADGMGLYGRKNFVSDPIMDVLSPNATKIFVNFAMKKGIFVFHFGKDEHAFVFPGTYSDLDVQEFFVEAMEELLKGAGYVLYRGEGWKSMPKAVGAQMERLAAGGANIVCAQHAGGYHMLVPQDIAQDPALGAALKNAQAERMEDYPFLFPGGGVRQKIPGKTFSELLRLAEEEAKKWEQEEVEGLSKKDRKKIWNDATEEEKFAMKEQAWDRAGKNDFGSKDQMPDDYIVEHGLYGLNLKVIGLKELTPEVLASEEKKEEDNRRLLPASDARIAERNAMCEQMNLRIGRIFKKAADAGRDYKKPDGTPLGVSADDEYTSYDERVLKAVVSELASLTPEEVREMDPSDRVVILRHAPVDFYVVCMNDDASVSVMHIDLMCHAEGLSGADKENTIKKMKKAVLGRASDYLVPSTLNQAEREKREKAISEAYKEMSKGNMTKEELRKVLEENASRVFPFKALNSLYSHEGADTFILEHGVSIFKAFQEFARSAPAGGLKIDRAGVGRILGDAHNLAAKDMTPDEWRAATGEPLVNIMYEVQMVNVKKETPKDTPEKIEEQADKALFRLSAMGMVRDPDTVELEGQVTKDFEARIREEIPETRKKYEAAFDAIMKNKMEKGEKDTRVKTAYMRGLLGKAREEIKIRQGKRKIEDMYKAGREVLKNITVDNTPLVVFIQCKDEPANTSGREATARKAAAEIAEACNINKEKIKIVFYADKNDLNRHAEDEKLIAMLRDKDARAVVFSLAGAKIHPKEGMGSADIEADNLPKDIFAQFNPKGNERVYYMEESYEGLSKDDIPDPLIGPHVALALGIKHFKAGNEDPAFLTTMATLFYELSASGVPFGMDAGGVKSFLNKLLNLGEPFKIKKLDFETFRDQIKAEEEAMKSL